MAEHSEKHVSLLQGSLVDIKLDEQCLANVRDVMTQVILVKNYRSVQVPQIAGEAVSHE